MRGKGKLSAHAHRTMLNNPYAKALLAYLAQTLDIYTGNRLPPISTISRDTAISERQIRRLLQVFSAIDLITLTPREIKPPSWEKLDRRRHAYDFALNLSLLGTNVAARFDAKLREVNGRGGRV